MYHNNSTAPRHTHNLHVLLVEAGYSTMTSFKTIIGTPPTIRHAIPVIWGVRTNKIIFKYACITLAHCQHWFRYFQHMSSVHPEQHCSVCGTTFGTSELLQAHLWVSSEHPKCDRCNMGFVNMEAQDFVGRFFTSQMSALK